MAVMSREEVARLLYQAGFRGDAIWKMLAIAGRESRYDPAAHRTDRPREAMSGDRGLWQINYVNDDTLRANGIDPANLFDPLTNARAAYLLSNGGANLNPWRASGKGFDPKGDPLYGTDQAAARATVNIVRNQGWAPSASAAGRPPPPDPSYFDWQSHPELNDQYNQFSPHLSAFERWTLGRYGGKSAEEYDERPITGGTAPSSHGFGAAWDWAPESRADGLKMVQLVTENPGAFGIQAIHDYAGGRIWHVDRATEGGSVEAGWKPYDFPAGDENDTHFHFEVNRDQWDRVGRRNWRMMGRAARGVYSGAGNPTAAEQRHATEDPAAQAQLTQLLRGFGVNYPDAPTPTPALLAYLRGVGLTLDTARSIRNTTLERTKINRRSAMEDIERASVRSKENVTGDLIQRGMLGSGEATTRYARQAEDVAAEQADVFNEAATTREDAQLLYRQAQDQIRQQVLERTLQTEEQQAITSASNRASARGSRQANRAAEDADAAAAQAQADELARLRRQVDRLRRRNRQAANNPPATNQPGGNRPNQPQPPEQQNPNRNRQATNAT